MKKWIIVIALLLGFACKKKNSNDCSVAVCPDIYIAGPFLRFNLLDNTTNQDLFFTSSPQYQLKDLAVYKYKNITDTAHLPVYIDSLTTSKHFVIISSEGIATVFIQIQNQKVDTIDIVSKPVFTNCCLSGYIFESLKLNGKLICNNCAASIVVNIKK